MLSIVSYLQAYCLLVFKKCLKKKKTHKLVYLSEFIQRLTLTLAFRYKKNNPNNNLCNNLLGRGDKTA